MKLSEFEEKLTTVADQKLRLMLADCRKKGPEVAVNLILAEGRRRGMDLEGEAPADGSSNGDGMAAMAALESPAGADETPAFAEESLGGGAAAKGAWLAEEANQGLPMIIKVLIAVVLLGGILAFLFVFLNKH